MRKLLLFLSIVAFVGLSSCSKDEVTEISQEEKELLVKQTLIEFNNSAVKTGKLQSFAKIWTSKSATASEAELEEILQNFLGDQTQVFLDLFYELEALNLSSEEFHSIANKYDYLRSHIRLNKNENGVCGVQGAVGDFLDWLFECEGSEAAEDN
ncbi:hypothetical protein M0D21_04520 [Aquimarina sp. D1M17]|uniref:hypothetical protein n=1 Tax=Aquimarina acroporae TaxID=2937283 RepID=UPI0020C0FABA|nr:hypothetical protein [Aquimarina acroporae]MCK8520814.1 hypothetical protein [Aquimarina acroporae]